MTHLNIRAEVYHSIGSRPAQEDGYLLAPVADGHLAAVFDGHWPGSDWLVNALVQQLPDAFAREYARSRPAGNTKVERRVLRGAVRRLVKRHQQEQSLGSTATVAWVRPVDRDMVRVHVAVLGDSPAALWDGQRLFVPALHDPEHHPDGKRVQAFIDTCLDSEGEDHHRYRRAGVGGGYVWLVSFGDYADGVAMTRAIGDGRFGALLNRRPEIHTRELPVAEGAVLLATDGVLTNDGSPRGVRIRMGEIVKQWIDEARPLDQVGSSIPVGSGDNRTIVGVRFWC